MDLGLQWEASVLCVSAGLARNGSSHVPRETQHNSFTVTFTSICVLHLSVASLFLTGISGFISARPRNVVNDAFLASAFRSSHSADDTRIQPFLLDRDVVSKSDVSHAH